MKAIHIFLLSVAVLLSSCVSQNKVTILKSDSPFPEKTVDFAKKSAYKIKIGDHLFIRIYSYEPKTSKFFQNDWPAFMNTTYLYLNSYMVDDDGYVNFSFIEKVRLAGLTMEEAQKILQTSINEYFKDATVYLRLINFQVSVMGEVASPGTFTIEKDQIDALKAISMAGGFNVFAKTKKVKLIRKTPTGSEIHILDFTSDNILASDYYYLMPDDIIYVEPRVAKSFAFDRFPYSAFLTIAATTLSIIAITK